MCELWPGNVWSSLGWGHSLRAPSIWASVRGSTRTCICAIIGLISCKYSSGSSSSEQRTYNHWLNLLDMAPCQIWCIAHPGFLEWYKTIGRHRKSYKCFCIQDHAEGHSDPPSFIWTDVGLWTICCEWEHYIVFAWLFTIFNSLRVKILFYVTQMAKHRTVFLEYLIIFLPHSQAYICIFSRVVRSYSRRACQVMGYSILYLYTPYMDLKILLLLFYPWTWLPNFIHIPMATSIAQNAWGSST